MMIVAGQSVTIVRDQVGNDGKPAANTHTSVLWKNGATTEVSITRTNPSTGSYAFTFLIPEDAVAYDVFSLRVVDGDGYAATVWEGCVQGSGGGGATLEEVLDVVNSIAIALAGSSPVEPTGTTVFEYLESFNEVLVETVSELSAPPAANSTLRDKITWIFQWLRNKSTQTATQRRLYADDGTTVVSTETVSDDGTTYTKGEQS